jgi:hypothetical protein
VDAVEWCFRPLVVDGCRVVRSLLSPLTLSSVLVVVGSYASVILALSRESEGERAARALPRGPVGSAPTSLAVAVDNPPTGARGPPLSFRSVGPVAVGPLAVVGARVGCSLPRFRQGKAASWPLGWSLLGLARPS